MTEAVNCLRTEVRAALGQRVMSVEVQALLLCSAFFNFFRLAPRSLPLTSSSLAPVYFSLRAQVSDLTQKFKDEVTAFKANQGGY